MSIGFLEIFDFFNASCLDRFVTAFILCSISLVKLDSRNLFLWPSRHCVIILYSISLVKLDSRNLFLWLNHLCFSQPSRHCTFILYNISLVKLGPQSILKCDTGFNNFKNKENGVLLALRCYPVQHIFGETGRLQSILEMSTFSLLNNSGFNSVEFDGIRKHTDLNSFTLAPKYYYSVHRRQYAKTSRCCPIQHIFGKTGTAISQLFILYAMSLVKSGPESANFLSCTLCLW